MESYERKAVFDLLKEHDYTAGNDDFIEVVQWHNGLGFDVEIVGRVGSEFKLTWGQFDALKKLVNEIEGHGLNT